MESGRSIPTYLGRRIVIIVTALLGVGVLGLDFLCKIRHF
jgi:hypothetical protein